MRYFILNIILQVLLTVSSLSIITYYIEKHSVHPEFGNYSKNIIIGNKTQICEPWDYCPPN